MKTIKNKIKPSPTTSILKRMFGDLPVRDARHELRVFALPCDIKDAKTGDPSQCVFAKACHRLFDAKKVFFFRSVAYLDLLQDDGNRVIERFIVPEKVKNLIIEFDKTGICPPGGFVLEPPTLSQRLDSGKRRRQSRDAAKRNYDTKKRRDRKKRREAVLKGDSVPTQDAKEWEITHQRWGNGMVHFTKKGEQQS